MPRDNRISLGFNDDEYKKLKQRANEAHLKLGDYVRWYLFNEAEKYRGFTPQAIDFNQSQYTIPYKAAPEVIEKIKEGKPVYVDPYQAAKLEAQKNFSTSGGLGELHNNIIMLSKGGRVLKEIPKKEIKQLEKYREERRHMANKHIDEIKKKNIEHGILNND